MSEYGSSDLSNVEARLNDIVAVLEDIARSLTMITNALSTSNALRVEVENTVTVETV
jgi:hypothetical protein